MIYLIYRNNDLLGVFSEKALAEKIISDDKSYYQNRYYQFPSSPTWQIKEIILNKVIHIG